MQLSTRFICAVLTRGFDVTVNTIAGDVCPCFATLDPPQYNPDWHKSFPDATPCHGTGLINRAASPITGKAIMIHASERLLSQYGFWVESTGRDRLDKSYFMLGPVNTSDNTLVEFADLDLPNVTVTWNGLTLTVKDYTLTEFGQIVMLQDESQG
jgi:hypothetical protein